VVVDLSVEFMGIKFKNPFLLASVPAATPEGFAKAAIAGWGGGIIWGGSEHHPLSFARGYIPRDIVRIGKPPQWWAYENTLCYRDPISYQHGEYKHPPDMVEAAVRKAKDSGIPVGCTIAEGKKVSSWANNALAADRGGADFIELNMSGPWLPGVGLSVGVHQDIMTDIVQAVRKASRLPVMVKLNASLQRDVLAESARAAVKAGANAISITNTFAGIIGVDVETGMPLACEMDINGKLRGIIGGISGPAIKPMGLRGVAEVRKAVDVPISGIGGITDWESAVEYMLLGASTVQIGTAAMLYGHRLIKEMLKGLSGYMERKGYTNLKDFVGMTSQKYAVGEAWAAPAQKQPRRMVVDEAICTGCGSCLIACDASSSGSEAIRVVNKVARINPERCHTCNACRIVCPEMAISVEWYPEYRT